MFPADPIYEIEFARLRQAEMDRQLERLRLVREGASQPAPSVGVADRALSSIGDTLIDLGLRLRERYAIEPVRYVR